MHKNIWEMIKECTAEESILCTVTDEDGNIVNIVSQIMYKPDGSVFDKSVMATNQSGILYPISTHAPTPGAKQKQPKNRVVFTKSKRFSQASSYAYFSL